MGSQSLRTMVVRHVTGRGALVRLAAASMLVVTAGTQHPSKIFKRLQHANLFAVVPYWGFFAPTPATRDYHVMARFVLRDGSGSAWQDIDFIEERRVRQLIWFPLGRHKKALYDLVADMLTVAERGADLMARTPAFSVLTAHVRSRLSAPDRDDVTGFQIAIVESTGYDDSTSPEVRIVSRPQPLTATSR